MQPDGIRVGICIPLGRDGGRADFWLSFNKLLTHGMASDLGLKDEPVIYWYTEQSSMVAQNRRRLVGYAKKDDCSHIFFLDDDMTFPANALARLLKHKKPVVATNCTTRAIPIIPTAITAAKRIPSVGKTGLERVDAVGCAVMLIEASVFDKIPLPWFHMAFNPDFPDRDTGEDMYFCRELKRAGIPLFIDHDLSLEIGHIGEMVYTHDMTDMDAVSDMNNRNAKLAISK